jgi:hypothetical protein
MCSNNNIIWTGVPFVMRHDYDPSTGRLTNRMLYYDANELIGMLK